MIDLRPYQRSCIAAVETAWAQNLRKVLVVMATGLGKTHMAVEIMRGAVRRALFLVHREEIVFDTARRIKALTGSDVGVEMADDKWGGERYVVGSIPSVKDRLGKFDPAQFDRVIIDEAHHATAASYVRVMNHFAQSNIVGLTATPNRTDKTAMGLVFDRCESDGGEVFNYPIATATNDGWLVPIEQQAIKVEGIDLDQIKTRGAKDFSDDQLEAQFNQEKSIHGIARPLFDAVGDRQFIAFTSGVESAEKLANVLGGYREGMAEFLFGKTKKDKRRGIVAAFQRGDLQGLCNYGVATEGFDAPRTSVLAIARPTKSLLVYTQMIGRATRPVVDNLNEFATAQERLVAIGQSVKPSALVMDFVGNSSKHKLITCEDALGGIYDLKVLEYAKQIRERDKQAGLRERSVNEALVLAQAERQVLQEMAERRAKMTAKVSYQSQAVDVYSGGIADWTDNGDIEPERGDASKGQRGFIWVLNRKLNRKAFSPQFMDKLSKRQASGLISSLIRECKSKGIDV